DAVILPPALVMPEVHEHLTALVTVLAVHARNLEGTRPRGGLENEYVSHIARQPPGEWLGDQDGARLELRPGAVRIAARETEPGVARRHELHRVQIDGSLRRGNRHAAALTVGRNARDGEQRCNGLRIESPLQAVGDARRAHVD